MLFEYVCYLSTYVHMLFEYVFYQSTYVIRVRMLLE